MLFYRRRSPLERGRGGTYAVALSDDGIEFRDVWGTTKEQLVSSFFYYEFTRPDRSHDLRVAIVG